MNKNIINKQDVTVEDLPELLEVGQKYLDELDETLKDIRVPVREMNPEVLEAIRYVFGEEYITDNNSYITYRMFRTCMDTLRNVGRVTAAEYIK